METTQTRIENASVPEWRATADEIWALLRENARQIKESSLEFSQWKKESALEFNQWREKNALEFDRKMEELRKQAKETDRRIGKFNNSFGEVVEYMVVPNLVGKFRELGFDFSKAGKDVEIVDREHDIILEADAFLENGDKAMIVEIKNKPRESDINNHIERMEKLRKYADLRGDKRQYLGAIAGVVFSDELKTYTLKHGFYVIEPSGETFRITEPAGNYHPHIW